MEEYLADLEKGEASTNVYYGVSPTGYENLSLNMAEVKSYIRQMLSIINYYQDLDKEDEHLGLSRFCRIRITIKKLDWLKLDYKGHQRLEFKFGKKIKTQWIAS